MGIERRILFEGLWKRGNTKIVEIPTTFHPSNEQKDIVEQKWKSRPHDVYDLPLWRYESYFATEKELELRVSRLSYKWHFILRHQEFDSLSDYPNPISVTTLITTTDRKLILGVRKGSDQGGMLHAIGGGFIDPFVISDPLDPADWAVIPEHPFDTAVREISEETSLTPSDYDESQFRLLGSVWGSNHDTSLVIHAPIDRESSEIDIRLPEHSQLVPTDLDSQQLQHIIERSQHPDVYQYQATDHCVLALTLLKKKHHNDS